MLFISDIHLFGSANENDDEVEHDPFYTGDEILGLAVSQKFIYVAPKIEIYHHAFRFRYTLVWKCK